MNEGIELRENAQRQPSEESSDAQSAATAEMDPAALFERLSPSSKTALGHADGVRRKLESDSLHMEHLIFGLYEKDSGPAQQLFASAGLDERSLRELIMQAVETRLPESGHYTPTALTMLPRLSHHVRQALTVAQQVAMANRSPFVRSRHLLYGALSIETCDFIQKLREWGVAKERIPLQNPAPAAAGPPPIAGYRSDAVDGKDLLGIDREVAALSAVVAATDAGPPLAVGLFGDWGSGKSFFMQEMEKTINAYSHRAQTARAEKRRSPFCEKIIQLRFNAWHYMDTDLWASLASEIFEGLGKELERQAKGDAAVSPLNRLLAAADSARNVVVEAERRRAAMEGELEESERRLSAIAQREVDIEASLNKRVLLRQVYKAALAQPKVSQGLNAAAEELRLPDLMNAAADVRAQLLELHGALGYARGLILSLRHGGRRIWVLSLLAVVLLSVGVPWVYQLAVAYNLNALVTSASAGLVSLSLALSPLLMNVRAAVKVVTDVRSANGKFIKDEQRRQEQAAEERQQAATAKRADAQARVAEAKDELQRLQQQLEEMRADRQMSKFLRERQTSADYTKHFGTIARARNDFERLSELLEEVRGQMTAEPAEGGQQARPIPIIDRIVLYIDDLDRCPEQKVVDVLQAVHLLLGLPLFVVVVGVDSRWLLHSLREHSKVFQPDTGTDDGFNEERVHWQSTPLNYLEKIFQIPFALRPMEPTGFNRLVDDMAEPSPRADGAHRTVKQVEANGGTVVVEYPLPTAGTNALPQTNVKPPLAEDVNPTEPLRPKIAEVDPEILQIGDLERTFIKLLYPLIPSPRAAKRFINVYRLLRANLDNEQRERLAAAGGDHPIILLMLAMLVGYPAETTEVLRDLIARTEHQPWWPFVLEFALRAETSATATAGEPQRYIAKMKTERWCELAAGLKAIEPRLPDLGFTNRFADWAPHVARYSFQSGRVMLARQDGEGPRAK